MSRPHHPGITDENIRALSLDLEDRTGFDSVATIERVYEPGSCCYPSCAARHRDPITMWRHVHFAGHGRSFGVSWADLPTLALGSERDLSDGGAT